MDDMREVVSYSTGYCIALCGSGVLVLLLSCTFGGERVGEWVGGWVEGKDGLREAVHWCRPTSLGPRQQTQCLLLCCPFPSMFLSPSTRLCVLQGLPALLVSLFSVYTANVGAVPELRPVAAQVLRCLQLMAAGDEAMQVGALWGSSLWVGQRRPGGGE